ncbi:MAG: asparaginase [Anaerolineae bacterium]
MKRILLLTTGGTIAMRERRPGEGATPALEAEDLLALLPPGSLDLRVERICNLPSAHLDLETLWALRNRVHRALSAGEADGVVITHGTDTMEETAYLLDLTVPGDAPVVLTGAMRTASDPGYDGPANLLAALRVAASDAARGLGAVIVMNDEVHAARYVTKTHTLNPATFRSPGAGPIGVVAGGEVRPLFRLARRTVDPPALDRRVALLKLAVGMEADLLECLLERGGLRGLVVEGLGGGRVPPWWVPALARARDQGVEVAVASRCPEGVVWDGYGYAGAHRDLARLGVLFAQGWNGPKCRIRLMAILGAVSEPAEVQRLWYALP